NPRRPPEPRSGNKNPAARRSVKCVRHQRTTTIRAALTHRREGGAPMPRSAVETPLTVSAGPALDDLLRRGRAQGRLSLDEVRGAFESAGISPAQGRSILRELSEAGISLAGDSDIVRKMAAAADHDGGDTAQAASTPRGTRGKPAAGARRKAAGRTGGKDTAPGEPADEPFEVTEVEPAGVTADETLDADPLDTGTVD